MRVPFSYLERQFQQAGSAQDPSLFYTDRIFSALREFIKTSDFTLGKPLQDFEEKFASFIGVKHAIGVNSGTDALILSLKALGVGPHDEVITSAETFIATAGAIAATGARPVFVDVDAQYLIDPDQIEKAITPRTKAIIPVWFTGNAPDMERIMIIARAHGIPVVEDSCCAIDASINGKKAGSWGITGTFSFHPLKNLNVWSDGGMITTNDDSVAKTLRLLRNHGLVDRDEVEIFGVNSRLDTLQAVVALEMFDDVPKITDARIANAQKFDEAFSKIPQVEVPQRHESIRHVFHLYMVRVAERDKLLQHCIEKGIEAKVHYPIPLPYQRCCAALGYTKGDFPKTEKDCASIITFPSHQHLTPEEVRYVIDTVTQFYGK